MTWQKIVVSDMVKASFLAGYALLTAASLYAAKKLQHNDDTQAANTIAMLNTAAGAVTGVAQYLRGSMIYNEAVTARGNYVHSYNESISHVCALLALTLGSLAIRFSSRADETMITASLAAAAGLVFSISGFFKHREGLWAVEGRLKKAKIEGIIPIPNLSNIPRINNVTNINNVNINLNNQIEGMSVNSVSGLNGESGGNHDGKYNGQYMSIEASAPSEYRLPAQNPV